MVEKLSNVQVNRHQIDTKSTWAVQLSRALLRQARSSWDGENDSSDITSVNGLFVQTCCSLHTCSVV